MRDAAYAQKLETGSLLRLLTEEKWACRPSTMPPRVHSGKKGGKSLFLKVKECTIANCWDKMEIAVL
jgi:hypothetical protein